jgi:hypothetical protein
MDPISIGLQAVGLGLQIFGGMETAKISKQQAQQSMAIAADEQKINEQKKIQQQMEMRRSQMQTLRNVQRQRAQGTAAAVNQGASTGSGLQGALAQNTDEGYFNLQGMNQANEISGNIFGINQDISSHKMELARLGGQAASAQGLASLGGSLIKIGPTVGAFGKDAAAWGKSNIPGTGFGGPYI